MAFSRGAMNVATRQVDPLRPETWEFSAFSQNGEDGIIDHLLSLIHEPNRHFLEIGASDGMENNTSFLAFAKKYTGVMVEGDRVRADTARRFLQPMNWGIIFMHQHVEPDNVGALLSALTHRDPDFMSLDIDSNDYHVMEAVLAGGLRPKVACVEYNSAFGPTRAVTIPYTRGLDYVAFHPSELYYGASVTAWRHLFAAAGYRFVCVDTRGVNAFFVDPGALDMRDDVKGRDFAENVAQARRHRVDWRGQFAMISELPFQEVGEGAP